MRDRRSDRIDGLNGQLIDPHLMQVNVNTLGLTMRMPIQYAWLDYAPGRTAKSPMGPYDVLTGSTSGAFYSVLMLSMPGNEWCVGGIKSVPPISHDTLKLQMLRD